MNFDIIIATYNRIDSLLNLIESIETCSLKPNKIIIVDASDINYQNMFNKENIVYIRSSHANQPYQRYLGYYVSTSDYLFYFDDDIIIKDKDFFKKSLSYYKNNSSLVGLAFSYESVHHFLDNMPQPVFQNILKKSFFYKALKNFIGSPTLKDGQYWLCGIKGLPPKEKDNNIFWFYGCAFSIKKDIAYKDFNFRLFDIYEMKLGKGEDAILGYTVSKQGNIKYINEKMLYHNDQGDSIYTKNHFSFFKRTYYSRLYHSFEYARLNNNKIIFVWIHYQWCMLWRTLGIFMNLTINYNPRRIDMLKGIFSGWKLAIKDTQKIMSYDNGMKWKEDAQNDAK